MKFKIGDIISPSGKNDSNARKVINILNDKYITSFLCSTRNNTYTWNKENVHSYFKLVIPDYIPEEQYEKYRKLKNE